MQLIEKIRTRFHQYFLNKELVDIKHKRSSVHLPTAKTVGILFDGTSPEERESVLSYAKGLEKEGKKVRLLAFVDQKENGEELPFTYFDRKKLDWALRPICQEVKAFEEFTFDLLLNLTQKAVAPLDYIAARSRARFRVGPFTGRLHSYDLMLDCKEGRGLEHFIKQVVTYLGKMSPKPVKEELMAAV